ncbi:MAG: CoA transferase, partial [Chloroflexi bacterium]
SHSFDVKSSRHGNTHQFFAPVSVYPTSDGFVYLAVGNDRQWEALTQQAGFESLADEKYVHNAGRIADAHGLNEQLSAILKKHSTAEMTDLCKKIGVPVSAVNRIADVCADPLIANYLVKARDPRTGTEIAISPPAVISAYLKEKGLTLGFPPRLGEHNASVFNALGCDVNELQAKGII